MPVKNGAKFIASFKETMEHLMRTGDELIIVDDQSQDNTVELLKPWIASCENVRLITNPNPGLANALNLGVSESSFDWIARVDVDDRYNSNRLNIQELLIAEDTVAIFSDYTLHTENGIKLGFIPSAVTPLATAFSLVSSIRTPHPSVVFNKTAFVSVGGYRQTDFPCEDLSLWLRLGKTGELRSAPSKLLNYRLSMSGVTSNKREAMKQTKRKLLDEIGIPIDPKKIDLSLLVLENKAIENTCAKNQRDLLLLRELHVARRIGMTSLVPTEFEAYLKSRILHNKKTISDVGMLAIEKMCISAYRSFR